MRRTAILLILTAIMSDTALTVAKDVYVATDGDDARGGTRDAPLATVEKAVEAMRGAGPGTIWIGPGEHYLPNGVALDAQHSGTANQPLVIRGAKPRTARLTGARVVTGFRPITPEEAQPLISDEAKRHVVVADLAAQGLPQLSAMPAQHRAHRCEEVIFDDRPMQSARWPNDDFAVFTEVVDAGASAPVHWVQREVYRPGSFRFPNNLIHHCPTGGVAYSGNEHVLELNEVHDVCLHYSDVGVFYTGRDWASRGNVVRWNYIHDVANNAGHGSAGIYLDDCDSGDTVVGNIVFGGVGRGLLLGGGRDNTIHGNIFINVPIGIHVDARGPRGITLDRPGSWNLLAKCAQVGYLSPLWKDRYPRLAEVMQHDPLLPMGNSIRSNLMVGCAKPFGLAGDVKPEWFDRQDNAEWPLTELPFLPEAGSDEPLDLTRLSEAWEKVPGFEPIPVEKIGLSHGR